MKGLLAKLRRSGDKPKGYVAEGVQPLQAEALIQAHGAWLALLATVLEREHVISGAELARCLSEFAALTAKDRPAEGRILAFPDGDGPGLSDASHDEKDPVAFKICISRPTGTAFRWTIGSTRKATHFGFKRPGT